MEMLLQAWPGGLIGRLGMEKLKGKRNHNFRIQSGTEGGKKDKEDHKHGQGINVEKLKTRKEVRIFLILQWISMMQSTSGLSVVEGTRPVLIEA